MTYNKLYDTIKVMSEYYSGLREGYRISNKRAIRSRLIATASALVFGLLANTLANNSAQERAEKRVRGGSVVEDSLTGIRSFTPGPWVHGDHQVVEVEKEDGSTCQVTYTIEPPLGGWLPPLNPFDYKNQDIDDSDCYR